MGGRVVLTGNFAGAYDARSSEQSKSAGAVHEVVLNSKTGEVLSAK